MNAFRNLICGAAISACCGLTGASDALAQAYPDHPIRIIVPYAAGGSTDVAARVVAANLSRTLGQRVYVENKSGANGEVGAEFAAKSAPDGYTILLASDSLLSNPYTLKTNKDVLKDMVPVIELSRQPIVLVVNPSLGVNSLAELIALAKQKPGLRYATGSGIGSPQHIVVQWFARLAGVKLQQVPYRGGGQAINDLIAGHVTIGSLGATPVIPHHKAGTLRILAQTTETRSPSLPEVPTYQEAGIKGLVLDQWIGVFVPTGTPAAIIERLNTEIGRALADPSVSQLLLQQAQQPVGGSATQFSHLIYKDAAMYERLAKELSADGH
ncbi:MAG: tripartite tricarboxylate transporter substrate binding protein [Pseudolabrys sp.]